MTITKHQDSKDINQMWNEFKGHIQNLVQKYIPQKTINHKHGYPWITNELRHLIRKRDRLYNKMTKTGNAKMKTGYKELKHRMQKETRQSYWNYISNIIAPEEKPSTKKIFSFLKSVKKESSGIPTLKRNGTTSSETHDKANTLNMQFQSVFTTDNDNIMPDMGKANYSPMNEINITENGVRKPKQG